MIGRASPPAWLLSHGLASVIAIAILTYFHIVVGEMVPKSLALQYAEKLALWITPPMLWTPMNGVTAIAVLQAKPAAMLRGVPGTRVRRLTR